METFVKVCFVVSHNCDRWDNMHTNFIYIIAVKAKPQFKASEGCIERDTLVRKWKETDGRLLTWLLAHLFPLSPNDAQLHPPDSYILT